MYIHTRIYSYNPLVMLFLILRHLKIDSQGLSLKTMLWYPYKPNRPIFELSGALTTMSGDGAHGTIFLSSPRDGRTGRPKFFYPTKKGGDYLWTNGTEDTSTPRGVCGRWWRRWRWCFVASYQHRSSFRYQGGMVFFVTKGVLVGTMLLSGDPRHRSPKETKVPWWW